MYNNLILVGDSAGQANPLVLEGIRYAIKFGRIAGQVSSKAIQAKEGGGGITDEGALYLMKKCGEMRSNRRSKRQAKSRTDGLA